MFGWQLVPEKEMGLRRKTWPDGIDTVDASTLQAAAHAASKPCQPIRKLFSLNINSYFLCVHTSSQYN